MMDILFIGNSYTYYSDMPEALFAPMAKKAGLDCRVSSVTVGGCTLERYVDENDSAGQKLRAAIAGQHYDLVILQEQGVRPAVAPELFFESAAALMQLLKGQAERFMFYATPGRKDGHADLLKLDMTGRELTEKLAASYDAVGQKFGLPVAHVGRAFLDYRAAHPAAELYDPDLLHPSLLGSTLAAEVILREILKNL